MEIYKFRKHLLALKKELKKGLPQRFCGAKDLWEKETQA